MNKYGVTGTVGFSLVVGVLIGILLGESVLAKQPPRRRQRPYRTTGKDEPKSQPKPQPWRDVTIGDEPGALPQIGDSHAFVGPLDVGFTCWTTASPNSDAGGSYDAVGDQANTYWTVACTNGTTDGCWWSYYVYLARGWTGLYNPPATWLYQACGNGIKFNCGETDTSRAIYMSGVKSRFGAGTYTLYVYVYPTSCQQTSSALSGTTFNFTVH